MSNDRKFVSPEEIRRMNEGIDKVNARGARAAFCSPGKYVILVERAEAFYRRADSAYSNRINSRIVRTLPCEARPFPNGVLLPEQQPGTQVTHVMVAAGKYGKGYLDADIKAFAMAGAWGTNVGAEDITQLLGPENPAANWLLEINVLADGKPDSPKDKNFGKVLYVKRIPAAEFAKDLTPELKAQLFAENLLETMIAEEAEQAKAGFGPKA